MKCHEKNVHGVTKVSSNVIFERKSWMEQTLDEKTEQEVRAKKFSRGSLTEKCEI